MTYLPDEYELVRDCRDLRCGDILIGVQHFSQSFWDFPLTFVRTSPPVSDLNVATVWLAGDQGLDGELLSWHVRKSWTGVLRLK